MTQPGIHLSIVVPVYNEERQVGETMRRIEAFMKLQSYSWECLIVSDGSKDKTDSIVNDFSKSHPNFQLIKDSINRGKGKAVREGVLGSRGRYILVTDADLSSPIKEVDKLLSALEAGADVAIGSRSKRAPNVDVQQSFKRMLSGRIFNLIVQWTVLKGFSDTQCGFKCFKSEAAHTLFRLQKLDGFSFDVEVLYLARQKNYKIEEIPVMWRQGKESKVRLFSDAWAMTKDLPTIKKVHR